MSVGWLRACALVMLGLFSVSALAKDKTAIVIGGGVSGLFRGAVELCLEVEDGGGADALDGLVLLRHHRRLRQPPQ